MSHDTPFVPVDFEAMVAAFHAAFGVEGYDGTPQSLVEVVRRRMTLISEEAKEVAEALQEVEAGAKPHQFPVQAMEHLAKELGDLLYVVFGTGHLLGIPVGKAFEAVHLSNLSKLGEDGKPVLREDGKVLKGPNYRQANLSDVALEILVGHLERQIAA